MKLLLVCLLLVATSVTAASFESTLTTSELKARAARAAGALRAPIVTVVDKPSASPSGNAHDYVSYARYWWPDPAKPDGLPYVNRDGQHNREQVGRGDHARLGTFFDTVEILAAAWKLDRNESAARRAGEWLRAWLVDPATLMRPNLNYAQVRLGRDENRGSPYGLIDARGFSKVIDALLLLKDSPALSPDDARAIRAWLEEYLHWLTSAPNALAERAGKNNHGAWYVAQVVPIARYLGRDDLAKVLFEETKERITAQFQPDGSQPAEIRRVDGLGYSVFNLQAHAQAARHAAALGFDLWKYEAPNRASLRQGLEFLRPYNRAPETWPLTQNEKLQPGFLDALLEEPAIAAAIDR